MNNMTQPSHISRALLERTLGYHGKPFQKIWETSRREDELQRIGIGNDPDFTVYTARSKHLTLKDRAKRLKLHQFMVKNADTLFDYALSIKPQRKLQGEYQECTQFAIPPMEVFLGPDTVEKAEQLLKNVQPGDVLYGAVVPKHNHNPNHGITLKPLLIIGNVTYCVRNLSIKATIAPAMMAPSVETVSGLVKSNQTANIIICCEVIDVAADARRLYCSTWRSAKSDRVPASIEYGLVKEDDIPSPYKLVLNRRDESYQDFLEQSPSFRDPSFTEELYRKVGLDSGEFYTNMSSMKGRYPSQEYAGELRNSQNSKWAFRSVAQGIEHFKEGRHSEAFQCLNKALNMDPRNVEGLVARGALYANSGSFKKAVDDFEAALKLNPAHANARKYMGETLVALGRSYEDENRFEEARKAYQDCLNIIPHHEEAQNSLDFLKTKPPYGKQIVEPTELELPALNIVKPSSSDRIKQEPDTSGVGGSGSGYGGGGGGTGSSKRDNSEPSRKDRKKESKKEKKKRHKKHHSSSSESSTDSSDSSESSSESSSSTSSDSSSSDSSGSRNKKRKRSKNEKKVKPPPLSPLSKRMIAGRGGAPPSGELVGYPIGQRSVFGQNSGHVQPGLDDYEQQVRMFLETPRDEEDYEEKVRRFVAEASKYQKERKQLEDKSKKKKKKEEKKAKKESKKKRKSDEKKKSKKKDKSGGGGDDDALDKDKLREALKIFENFPVLDELGSKLSEYYAKIEKQQSTSGSVAEALSAILGTGAGSSAGAGGSRAKPAELPVNLERGGGPSAADDNNKDGKWRMMFNKDKRPTGKEPVPAGPSSAAASSSSIGVGSKQQPQQQQQQYPFSNDSDEESAGGGGPYGAPKIQPYVDARGSRFGGGGGGGGSRYDDHRGGRGGSVEKMKPSSANMVKSGPVVLDKFGNFRLATAETMTTAAGGAGAGGSKPPEPSVAPPGSSSRRSRSKSRHRTYGSSRSRSRSRSERRRSRSGSFRRRFSRSRSRSFSRSRSGSYSRSRSRSRSFERRRFDRRIYRGGRGGGGGGYGGGDRMGSFGGNRFNNPRGHYRRGGFRDFRDNRFMGGRGGGGGGGGGGRDRPPFRPRYRGRFQRSYSRSTSKSPDRRPISPGDDRHSRRDHSRRGDSRDRSMMAQGRGGGGGADSRERSSPPPSRRGSSRADSRENQRGDSRHRRSEDREPPSRRRSKDDAAPSAANSKAERNVDSKVGGEDEAATNDSSPAASPRKDAGGKDQRRARRSSSAASHNSSGSARIPPDVEGRWADEPSEDGGAARRRDADNGADEHRSRKGSPSSEAGQGGGGSHSSAAAVADDATLEELEKMLTKARKERKEDMLERNKDLLKKNSSGGGSGSGF